MATKERTHILLSFSCYFLFINLSNSLTNTLLQGQKLKDTEYLISADGTFRLGFFSPGTSRSRYLGIRYNMVDESAVFIPKKRNNPISDASGILSLDKLGKLRISCNGGTSISLISVAAENNVSATLLDSGNFAMKEMNLDGSSKQILWESFDYPTDTLLPGMKLGIDEKNGRAWSLTSWINDNLPAQGSFSFTIGVGINARSSQLIIYGGVPFK